MPKPTTKARRLVAAGELLYGTRWQSPLARAIGIAQSSISMMVAGDRAVTDDVERKLAAALEREAARLRDAADKIDRLRGELDQHSGK